MPPYPKIHYLELFYYVAKFRGITPAVRQMPYGIQQPAVSGQVLQLEKDLGIKLFNRRPFALTAEGEQLYAAIAPFFSKLPEITAQLRGEEQFHLRIAAGATVLSTHLPAVFTEMRRSFPKLRLTLREASVSNVGELISEQEVDIGITILDGSLPRSAQTIELFRLPPILLVPDKHRIRSFRSLHKNSDEISEPLIAPAANEPLSLLFQKELKKCGIRWEPRMEVTALNVIQEYVSQGFGIGLSIDIPGQAIPSEIRKVTLPKFSPVVVGLAFVGKLKPIANRFAEMALKHAATVVHKKKK